MTRALVLCLLAAALAAAQNSKSPAAGFPDFKPAYDLQKLDPAKFKSPLEGILVDVCKISPGSADCVCKKAANPRQCVADHKRAADEFRRRVRQRIQDGKVQQAKFRSSFPDPLPPSEAPVPQAPPTTRKTVRIVGMEDGPKEIPPQQ